ncbi:hypothetical protein PPL_06922 [Heterostelium album PN500]|uniref:Uncharacterized protein n=1 Tax=Heterostelium pallidum (strain ATCC 26659 / Pp 5 / PN500) TaxID=670386 RepID=D3BDW9_HETP5|nr:hypothetical protein PPL_06922 [Heterostelium album PN500]EFA80100.1 hypothetical protein PPL_06922 [Heterostelium album PN500]|eukprot:XP_020432220.1 hypothetical protein PPL_06922 [Heterostelium album PN500]
MITIILLNIIIILQYSLNINLCQDIGDDHTCIDSDPQEPPIYNIKCLFTLKSYQTSILESLNQKSNCTLTYGRYFYQTDYSVNPYSSPEVKINRLKPNITKVNICEQYNNKYLKEIYRVVSNSNVSTLKGITSLSRVLPVNLTSITFNDDLDEELFAGYLPPNLKKLKFKWYSSFNQAIEPGVLSNTLKKLKFGECFNQPIEPNVLPASLTFLELGLDFSETLQVGSLPPNLRVLKCYGNSAISDGVLPKSLCTLESPLSWMPFIKSLDNLTTLRLSQSDSYSLGISVNLADLPVSLTNLNISTSCILTSSISPSIRYLDIHHTEYDIDEIFKDRSRYNFERLCVNGAKNESLDNLKIKELKLQFYKHASFMRDIPFGVETLNIGYFALKNIVAKVIPSSVKKVIFQNNEPIDQMDFKIPDSVEEVEILNFISDKPLSSFLLPNSAKSLTIPFVMVQHQK